MFSGFIFATQSYMKYINTVIAFLFCLLTTANAQQWRIDAFGGMANYNGDLQQRRFTTQQAKTAGALGVSYDVTDKWMLRGGIVLASVKASDAYQTDSLRRRRNLSFATHVWEANAGVEFHPLGLRSSILSPYVFAGIGVFHFNPYTFNASGQKTYLRALSTEGQGLSIYPNLQSYALFQFAIPLAAGVRLQLNDRWDAGVEIAFRKLFTDYLDDVSNRYPDFFTLLQERGPEAVSLSFRTPELPAHSNTPFPPAGTMRGSPRYKDNYYFAGITLAYKLGQSGNATYGSGGLLRRYRAGQKCPPVRW